MGSRVELFAAIRRDERVEGLSIRELAGRYRVHRRTVRQALVSVEPPARKTPVRRAPRLGPFLDVIDEMLRHDLSAPRKQRHTAKRVLDRLVAEHGAVGLSYSTVRDHVRKRRVVIAVEGVEPAREAAVEQLHLPGQEAEVDFGDVTVEIGGVRQVVQLFGLRLSASGKTVHRVFPSASQEAFLEGHIHAFEVLGGVPTVHVRYDNLTAAVSDVIFGRGRLRRESERWVMFRSHYGFDAFYCLPGIAGAHEKGGIEGEVGRFRRNHLVPVPQVASLDELNDLIAVWDADDDARRIGQRSSTVGEDFAAEAPLLAPLPDEGFDPGLPLSPLVNKSSMITVRQVQYSVPVRYIGRKVRVSLRAGHVVVFDGAVEVARHTRLITRGDRSLVLDHYLETLAFKPGSLPGSRALDQARTAGVFTNTHDAFWVAARRAHGDKDGTVELVEVLMLHRHLPAGHVIAGMAAALKVGATRAEVVALEARLAAAALTIPDGQVASLDDYRHPTRLALPPDQRPQPSLDAYDELLPTRRTTTKEKTA